MVIFSRSSASPPPRSEREVDLSVQDPGPSPSPDPPKVPLAGVSKSGVHTVVRQSDFHTSAFAEFDDNSSSYPHHRLG
ncbi:unnamed protein product [Prunus armeniaca]|uniref:Uncharacterized protein n=1 Tax=Prunus armeniaca TaxID=36596 RepID=A0A6J5UHF6_PRUAR|nr:unnamed protein product [Prunus armeniaca]